MFVVVLIRAYQRISPALQGLGIFPPQHMQCSFHSLVHCFLITNCYFHVHTKCSTLFEQVIKQVICSLMKNILPEDMFLKIKWNVNLYETHLERLLFSV
jgi:hypothetical protein